MKNGLASLVALVVLFSPGCGVLSLNLNRGINEFGPKDEVRPGHSPSSVPIIAKPFIGLAISGGGSRSANFAAAVMQELERYGFLEHVTAISAVSGGTLPAAYYVLNRNRPEWSWDTLRELMRTNFYRKFLFKHFNPWGLVNYLTTEYNRSEMMADVFDDVLFHGATFRDLEQGSPSLFINATPLSGPTKEQWRFTEKNFSWLSSRLETYPISRAIAASTAVPGIFNGIPLRIYREDGPPQYMHLVDGGVIENLGLETLLDLYIQTRPYTPSSIDTGEPPGGCFIFAVDSFPDVLPSDESTNQRDLRAGMDFIIDRNLLTSIDVMSANARDRFFRTHKLWPGPDGPFFPLTYHNASIDYRCTIWHIHFEYLSQSLRFYSPEKEASLTEMRHNLRLILPTIQTHWKLVASGSCDQMTLQDALYAGAKSLIGHDKLSHGWARSWFEARGFTLKGKWPVEAEEAGYDFYKRLKVEYPIWLGGRVDQLCNSS